MSGGSYDYLYLKDELDAFAYQNDMLEAMITRLEALGYPDLAEATRELKEWAQKIEREFMARRARLAPLWKAVEMYDSADWGEESVHKAAAEVRAQL